jgi:hypothetical protein
MPHFTLQGLGSIVQRQLPIELTTLIEQAAMPSLVSGPHDPGLTKWLRDASNRRTLSPKSQAAIWLVAGDLDASHTISQSIDDADGSFWHGIMHRREGDYGNAKYWFRRVGKHPVLDQLAQGAYGDPYAFVDAVQRSVNRKEAVGELAALQWDEWQSLFLHCLDASDERPADIDATT